MRGRHAAELTHELRRALRARLATRERGYQALRLKLETFDVRRRLGAIRARLVAADGRLRSALAEREHEADARLGRAAARLETLSPLAVLGRGYAVCWNADRTAILRDADDRVAGRSRARHARARRARLSRSHEPQRHKDTEIIRRPASVPLCLCGSWE